MPRAACRVPHAVCRVPCGSFRGALAGPRAFRAIDLVPSDASLAKPGASSPPLMSPSPTSDALGAYLAQNPTLLAADDTCRDFAASCSYPFYNET